MRARRTARRRRVETAVWLAVAGAALIVAASRWAADRWAADRWADGRWPAVAGVVAVVALVASVARRPRPDPERWLRGAAGEVATAQILDGLGRRRWVVLHDRRLPGSRANVDHLVIGRRGVWVLDSKAYRAPVRARWGRVRVGDRRLDPSAVAWEASVVADRLGVDVRPLVVVHGTGLPRRGRRCDGVRVVPSDGVVRHLRRSRTGIRLDRSSRAALADRAATVLPEA